MDSSFPPSGQQKTQTEQKLYDSNAQPNHAITCFEGKNQGDGGENCREFANNEQFDWQWKPKRSKNVHEKSAETISESEFEQTCYDSISYVEEDQQEEYISKSMTRGTTPSTWKLRFVITFCKKTRQRPTRRWANASSLFDGGELSNQQDH